MTPLCERYFAAWNARDTRALTELFSADGQFSDPLLSLPTPVFDLKAVLETLQHTLSDYEFTVTATQENESLSLISWSLTGSNDAPFKPGLPATHRRITLEGMESLQIDQGRIVFARRLFDSRTLFERLGFQVIVEPRTIGKMSFGYSLHASSGNPKQPEILALTWIAARDESERNRIREHSRQIIQDFLEEPGFIGIVTGFADRGFTVSAWENEAALHRALDRQHSRAKHEFKSADLSPGVWTSVWKPERLNRLWTRCSSCQQPNDVSDDRRSCERCGAELPSRPSYW